MNSYENLANAIVLQAVKDYRSGLATLKKNKHNTSAKNIVEEVQRFFMSQWFEHLTNIDATMLMKRLKQEGEVL